MFKGIELLRISKVHPFGYRCFRYFFGNVSHPRLTGSSRSIHLKKINVFGRYFFGNVSHPRIPIGNHEQKRRSIWEIWLGRNDKAQVDSEFRCSWWTPRFEFLVHFRQNVDQLGCSFELHPGRLTWNLQITHLERKTIFQTSMIRRGVDSNKKNVKNPQILGE